MSEDPKKNQDDELRFAPSLEEGDDAPQVPTEDTPDEEVTSEMDALAAAIEEIGDGNISFASTPAPQDTPAPTIRYSTNQVNFQQLFPEVSSQIDVDAALDAVSDLDAMLARQDAEDRAVREAERAAREARETEARKIREAEAAHAARIADLEGNPLPQPPFLQLRRGQPASMLPAAGMISLGIWLMVAYATNTAPPPLVVGSVIAGVLSLLMLAGWAITGGWNRGQLFLGLFVLAIAGTILGTATVLPGGLATGWPLMIAAVGLAMLLSGLFGRPREMGFALPGVLLIVVGVVGFAVTADQFSPVILDTIRTYWPVTAIVGVVFLLLPVFRWVSGR